MTKLEILKEQLTAARDKLKESLALEPLEFNKVACIQVFKATFELSWKYMKEIMAVGGTQATESPRGTIKMAGKLGLIDNVEDWLKLLNARNLTSHTYNEKTADIVYKDLTDVVQTVDKLIQAANEYLNNN